MSPKRRKEARARAAINAAVRERAQGRCEIRAPGCWGRGTSAHEIHKRSRFPGSQVDDSPKVWACSHCNSYVEDQPMWAETHGWSVPSGRPSKVTRTISQGGSQVVSPDLGDAS
jgi:hypothetical protein